MTEADPAWLERLDHTADEGVVVQAADLASLFARTAWAMFSLITNLDDVRDVERIEVSVDAPDREALLVRWLSELNFLHQSRRVVFSVFEITGLAEGRLCAVAGGEPIDRRRHTIHAEIKAVTFHQLDIRKTDDGWRARVIFDM